MPADPARVADEAVEDFLGVKRSLSAKRWVRRSGDQRLGMAMSQQLGVPDVVGQLLAQRGVEMEDAARFLDPSIKTYMPDPSHLLDMDTGAERIATAIMQGETVAIFGDYDVDGATSSALLSRFIRATGGRVRVYIPDRLAEGYGPNAPALMRLKDEGASVVITVDCGITAFEALGAATDAGLDVLVVDHHVAEPKLPKAVAVINPNRLDDTSEHGTLAAVGVAFLLVVAVNRTLRDAGWFKDRAAPDLMQWLDIVALGTVCDVVPLVGLNRALVAKGLKVMAARRNAGLRALADVAGIDQAPGTYHAGYVLGPRVNAGGRVGKSDLGARLLATDDPGEAAGLAEQLDAFNRERQAIEARVLEEALAEAERTGAAAEPLVFVAGEGWHPGVVGIVASRLKEKFNRPACVMALDDETGTASGRSVAGVDLGAAVIAARQAGVLTKGGGHKMAAGFAIDRARLEDAKAFLRDRIAPMVEAADLSPRLHIDAALRPSAATPGLLEKIDRVGPFGTANPEPRFAITNARIGFADPVGKDQSHLRLQLEDEGNWRLSAIAFRAVETEMGQALLNHGGRTFHVAGKLRLNHWQGRTTVQLIVDDAVLA